MCELLVGLAEVDVVGVEDEAVGPIVVHVRSRLDQGWCRVCGVRAGVKDWQQVTFVDLPCFGRATRLVWHKQRWRCAESLCEAGSWTVLDERIAWPRARLSDRAARWVTAQVGKLGRSVNEVAVELGCDWHTANDAVVSYGEALLAADTGGTNFAAAVDRALDIAADHPGFRQIVVLITDLEDGSGIPMDVTFDRLDGMEVVVVSIGDAKPANGVTAIHLRDSQDIARRIAHEINESRNKS